MREILPERTDCGGGGIARRSGRLALASSVAAALLLLGGPGPAGADDGEEVPLVLAGLRPAAGPKLNGLAIENIADSQKIRRVAANAIAMTTGRTVIGHDELRELLGSGYLVGLYDCERAACIARILAPLVDDGINEVLIGAYYEGEDAYTIEIQVVSLEKAEALDAKRFKMKRDELRSSARWAEELSDMLSEDGSIELRTNVEDFECSIDAQPCRVRPGTNTIAVSPGEHVIELSKEGYEQNSKTVTVARGETVVLAVPLKREPSLRDLLESGQVDPTELFAKRDGIRVGGGARFRYNLPLYDEVAKNKLGQLEFGTFILSFLGSYKGFSLSAQYRWVGSTDFIRYMWVGYDINDQWTIRAGIAPVPFGLYAGFQTLYGAAFLFGFHDDYDQGITLTRKGTPLSFDVGFFKNSEYGNPERLGRFSFDVVHSEEQKNSEHNQVNLRLEYKHLLSQGSYLEFGISGQAGQLYNADTARMGTRFAGALHADVQLSDFVVKAQATGFDHRPENPVGSEEDFVHVGAFDFNMKLIDRGLLLEGALARNLNIDLARFDRAALYGSYTHLLKAHGYPSSQWIVLGGRVTGGQVVVELDWYLTRNLPVWGPVFSGFAEGIEDAPWENRIIGIVAYYF